MAKYKNVDEAYRKSQVKATKSAKERAKIKEAVDALQKRVSPSGVKKAESGAKKAIDKKYPGLYKKSK